MKRTTQQTVKAIRLYGRLGSARLGRAMRLSHLEVLRWTFKRFVPRLGIVVALAPTLTVVSAYCSAPIGRSPGTTGRCDRYYEHGKVAGIHYQQLSSSSSSSTHFFRRRVGWGGVEAVGATAVTVQEGAKRSAVRLPEDHLLRPTFQKLEQMLTRYVINTKYCT